MLLEPLLELPHLGTGPFRETAGTNAGTTPGTPGALTSGGTGAILLGLLLDRAPELPRTSTRSMRTRGAAREGLPKQMLWSLVPRTTTAASCSLVHGPPCDLGGCADTHHSARRGRQVLRATQRRNLLCRIWGPSTVAPPLLRGMRGVQGAMLPLVTSGVSSSAPVCSAGLQERCACGCGSAARPSATWSAGCPLT